MKGSQGYGAASFFLMAMCFFVALLALILLFLFGTWFFFLRPNLVDQPSPPSAAVPASVVSATSSATFASFAPAPFDTNNLFNSEGASQETTFTDSNTGDVVSLQLLTDKTHQAVNPTFDAYVDQQLAGQVGGQIRSTFSFSPDSEYFAYLESSDSGCAGACRTFSIFVIQITPPRVLELSSPSLKEGNALNEENHQYEDVLPYIQSYSWSGDHGIDITSYAVGVDAAGDFYQITPTEVWHYDFVTGEYTLVSTSTASGD